MSAAARPIAEFSHSTTSGWDPFDQRRYPEVGRVVALVSGWGGFAARRTSREIVGRRGAVVHRHAWAATLPMDRLPELVAALHDVLGISLEFEERIYAPRIPSEDVILDVARGVLWSRGRRHDHHHWGVRTYFVRADAPTPYPGEEPERWWPGDVVGAPCPHGCLPQWAVTREPVPSAPHRTWDGWDRVCAHRHKAGVQYEYVPSFAAALGRLKEMSR